MQNVITEFSRVVLLQDIKHGDKIIKTGTIGTVRAFLETDGVVLQYSFDEMPQYVGVPIALVKLATIKDLMKVEDYRDLIPTIYHLGNMFSVQQGLNKQGEKEFENAIVVGVQLATHESKDEFELQYRGGRTEVKNKAYMDNLCSYVPFEMDEFEDRQSYYRVIPRSVEEVDEPYPVCHPEQNDNINMETTDKDESEVKLDIEEDKENEDIKLTIGGFEFEVANGIVSLPNAIYLTDIVKFRKALKKLEILIQEEIEEND